MGTLSKIPTEIWVVVATGVVAAIGWFGRTAFDAWNKSRLPFKQDRDRYETVMASVDPNDLFYFKDPDYSCAPKRHLDGVGDAAAKLSELRHPSYLNKKLASKEKALVASFEAFADALSLKCFPYRANANVFTIYWDTFDESKNEDQERALEIKRGLNRERDRAIAAFEEYRDFGNRLFADRINKDKSDG